MQVSSKIWLFSGLKSSETNNSWWVDSSPEPVLIDCPEITTKSLNKLYELAGSRRPKIILTSKYSHENVKKLKSVFDWPVLVQEQEAYLMPALEGLESFSEEYLTKSMLRVLWTPGPTPGSCVVHAPSPLNVLFCGRLLTPASSSRLRSLRTSQTFNWSIQLKSLSKLKDWIPLDSLPLLASAIAPKDMDASQLFPWESWDECFEN